MSDPSRPRRPFEPVEYHLDGDDRFVWVNDAWRFFADENQAALTTREPIGCRLWDFISDTTTRHLYEAMFERVRRSQDAITVEFRCDAPRLRRFLALTMTCRDAARLVLRVTALGIEAREPVALLDLRHSHDERLITMCSWCKRVETGNGAWADAEDAVRALGLFRTATLPAVTHGICGACAARIALAAGREP